ncbi:hypothetical protein ACROYT_G019964 [Oculina patagonica]
MDGKCPVMSFKYVYGLDNAGQRLGVKILITIQPILNETSTGVISQNPRSNPPFTICCFYDCPALSPLAVLQLLVFPNTMAKEAALKCSLQLFCSAFTIIMM